MTVVEGVKRGRIGFRQIFPALRKNCVKVSTSVNYFGGQSASDGDACYHFGNPYECRTLGINFIKIGVWKVDQNWDEVTHCRSGLLFIRDKKDEKSGVGSTQSKPESTQG